MSSLYKMGKIIDGEDEVGGWSELKFTTPLAGTDHDGMPDDWETARGLEPNDTNTSSGDFDGDGYTNRRRIH